jgi:peptidyl-prolyl cis-trans isomerase-like protein 2
VEQLNIKAKNLRDLLTDEPFSRQDIITLQVKSFTGSALP